jgi:hypothetical protein
VDKLGQVDWIKFMGRRPDLVGRVAVARRLSELCGHSAVAGERSSSYIIQTLQNWLRQALASAAELGLIAMHQLQKISPGAQLYLSFRVLC